MLRALHRLRENLAATGKPHEVEGVLDLYLIRPGGLLVAGLLRPTSISPHLVSVAALLAGWVTAYYLYRTASAGNDGRFTLLAAVALYVHSAFDSADGQLARWRGEGSDLGRLIDGISDYLTFAAIYLSIGFGLAARGDSTLGPVLLAAVAGLCHAVQCAIVEYQRNLFRYHVYSTPLAAADSPTEHAVRLRAESRAGLGVAHRVHLVYSWAQQALGGSSLRLRERLRSWLEAHPHSGDRVARVLADENTARLRAWALLAPNSHKVGMIVGALPILATPRFGSLGLYWYLLYVVFGLNLVMLVLIRLQRESDERSWQALNQHGEDGGS